MPLRKGRNVISLDTNVLVRLLTNDDKAQARKAIELFREHEIFITKTVCLETEWVLRYSYEIEKSDIIGAFEKLLGLKNVHIEDLFNVVQAFRWYKEGMDFADALHLAASAASTKMATFDRKFITRAKKLAAKPELMCLG